MKGRPSSPTRCCRKKTGPLSWTLMSTAATASTGAAEQQDQRRDNEVQRPLGQQLCSSDRDVLDTEERLKSQGHGRSNVWAIPDRPVETCT